MSAPLNGTSIIAKHLGRLNHVSLNWKTRKSQRDRALSLSSHARRSQNTIDVTGNSVAGGRADRSCVRWHIKQRFPIYHVVFYHDSPYHAVSYHVVFHKPRFLLYHGTKLSPTTMSLTMLYLTTMRPTTLFLSLWLSGPTGQMDPRVRWTHGSDGPTSQMDPRIRLTHGQGEYVTQHLHVCRYAVCCSIWEPGLIKGASGLTYSFDDLTGLVSETSQWCFSFLSVTPALPEYS